MTNNRSHLLTRHHDLRSLRAASAYDITQIANLAPRHMPIKEQKNGCQCLILRGRAYILPYREMRQKAVRVDRM
jgi:hypothetical protein